MESSARSRYLVLTHLRPSLMGVLLALMCLVGALLVSVLLALMSLVVHLSPDTAPAHAAQPRHQSPVREQPPLRDEIKTGDEPIVCSGVQYQNRCQYWRECTKPTADKMFGNPDVHKNFVPDMTPYFACGEDPCTPSTIYCWRKWTDEIRTLGDDTQKSPPGELPPHGSDRIITEDKDTQPPVGDQINTGGNCVPPDSLDPRARWEWVQRHCRTVAERPDRSGWPPLPLPNPHPPQLACQARTPQEAYIKGFQEGFVSCIIGTVTSPVVLLSALIADAGDQFNAAAALVRGDTATAANILHIKGERNRQDFEALVRSLNPKVIQVSPEEAGRRHGSRICQWWVLPQLVGARGSRKPVTGGTSPGGTPTSIPMHRDAYYGALRLPFPAQYANAIAVLVDTVARQAALRVVKDPRFVNALANNNMALAGTLFHSAAKIEANALRRQVPQGWKMYVEESTIDPKGDAIRIDLYFRGPCGELLLFDWKTSASSALKAVEQIDIYMGTLQWQYPGSTAVAAQSVSWVDYVRPLLPGHFAKYNLRR